MKLTDELSQLLDQKLAPIGKFLPEGETDLSCDVELEKVTEHQSGKIHRAEINLRVAGKLYRAEATEDQMELAIDIMRDEVKKELRRDTEKQHSLLKRGGQKVKEMLRFGGEGNE